MPAVTPARDRAYWEGELGRAKKRFRTFWDEGDQVIDSYRLQKQDTTTMGYKDKYNILYSSTETIRPNLYSQTPNARVKLRSKDTATDVARAAATLLEGCIEYIMHEEDLDDLMDGVVEDFLLPGIGCAWVRYEARFEDVQDTDEQGQPVLDKKGNPQTRQRLLDEMVKIEYTYWQDFLCGVARKWKDIPWVAKRLYLTREDAKARFGTDKANGLTYQTRDNVSRDMDNPSETAEAWEIWNKSDRSVYWYAESYADGLLDSHPDPLKLKKFFPCPRPIRAVSNTRSFVPRSLYSQYKSQAETLNVMTKRIRLLGEALRVVGLYDGSQMKLNDVLNPAAGNRMIAVDSWAVFAQNGGIAGSVQWLPIDQIVKVLGELLQARETCKAEIYEITGFSDILRGVSKASETLGAQNIKNDWGSARVKKLQYEVQRFARDLMALVGELVAEHCDPVTIALFSGVPIPDPKAVQANPALQQQVQSFKAATDLIRNEIQRVATIEIETDSTLLADESAERDDRTKFLAAAGAFLQQAVPAAESTPELGPLLGAMLMFVVRTFPSSRPIEEEFEKVQQVLAQGAQQGGNQDKDGKKAAAQAQIQAAQIQAQSVQAKVQADTQLKQQELQIRQQNETQKNQADAAAEQNRHAEKMLELQIRQQEIALKNRELDQTDDKNAIAAETANTAKFTALHTAGMNEMGVMQEAEKAASQEALEYEAMDREDARHKATLDAQTEQAKAQAAAAPAASDEA